MKQSQRIVKNALSGVAAEATGGLLHLLTLLLIARSVPVDSFGTFSFVVAFAGIFQLVADFGLSNILVREMAAKREATAEILGAAKSLIWILTGGAAILMLLTVAVLRLPFDVKILTLIMGLATLALFHAGGYTAVFRAFEEMEYNALGYVLHKILLLALVYGCLKGGWELRGVVAAHLTANAALWGFYYRLVCRRYTRPKMIADRSRWKSLIRQALPLGGGMVLRQAAWQADILLLTWLAGLSAVGLFSGPYRLMMALNLLPLVLALPLFPVYARLDREDPAAFRQAYARAFKFFCLVSFPIATALFVWADPIVVGLLGAPYAPSASVLRFLSVAFIPLFASALFPYLFTALGEQRRFLWTIGAGLGARILLNILLIPPFGYLGACVSVLVGETAVLGIGIHQLRRSGNPLPLARIIWRPVLGAAVMAGTLYAAQGRPLPWGAAAGVAGIFLYVAALLALKAFSAEDFRLAREGLGFFTEKR